MDSVSNKKESAGWVYSASARRDFLKKIEGFEEWFYCGPTLNFGHYQPSGNKK